MHIKSFIILLHYAEACNELAGPTSVSLRSKNTTPFEEMVQWWLAVCDAVHDLTVSRFEAQASRSRGEHVAAQPSGQSMQICNYLLL